MKSNRNVAFLVTIHICSKFSTFAKIPNSDELRFR